MYLGNLKFYPLSAKSHHPSYTENIRRCVRVHPRNDQQGFRGASRATNFFTLLQVTNGARQIKCLKAGNVAKF